MTVEELLELIQESKIPMDAEIAVHKDEYPEMTMWPLYEKYDDRENELVLEA